MGHFLGGQLQTEVLFFWFNICIVNVVVEAVHVTLLKQKIIFLKNFSLILQTGCWTTTKFSGVPVTMVILKVSLGSSSHLMVFLMSHWDVSPWPGSQKGSATKCQGTCLVLKPFLCLSITILWPFCSSFLYIIITAPTSLVLCVIFLHIFCGELNLHDLC